MNFTQPVKAINSNPKNIFLIDGAGALLSAFLLGVVLVELEAFFRIPIPVLYWLAFFPCLFAIYDFYCYKNDSKNLTFYLKGIAFLNLTYCCLSLGLAAYHSQTISLYGWTYILLEVIIVLSIAILELKVASKKTTTQ